MSLQEFEVSLRMGLRCRVQAASQEAAIEEYKRATGVIASDHPFVVVPISRTVAPAPAPAGPTPPTEPTASKESNTKTVMRIHEYASAKGLETSVVVAAAKDMNFDSSHPSSGLTAEEIELLDEYLASR